MATLKGKNTSYGLVEVRQESNDGEYRNSLRR